MPLKKGREHIAENIRELTAANKAKPKAKRRGRRQILAIAHRAAGVSRGR